MDWDLAEKDAALNELSLFVNQVLLDHCQRGFVALFRQRSEVTVGFTADGLLSFGVGAHQRCFSKTLALSKRLEVAIALAQVQELLPEAVQDSFVHFAVLHPEFFLYDVDHLLDELVIAEGLRSFGLLVRTLRDSKEQLPEQYADFDVALLEANVVH